jgi:hypothetical protein
MIYNNFAKNKRSKNFLNISILAMLWKLNYTYIQVSTHPKRPTRPTTKEQKIDRETPKLRKIKRGASHYSKQTLCTTFNFAQPHPKYFTKKIGITEYKFLFLSKTSRQKHQDNGSKFWRIY